MNTPFVAELRTFIQSNINDEKMPIEVEKKIRKIKTMQGEIALAHGVFQQPGSSFTPCLPAGDNGSYQLPFTDCSLGKPDRDVTALRAANRCTQASW